MSGDMHEAAAQDAAIDRFYVENPVGSPNYRANAGQLRNLMEQRHGTEPADGRTIVRTEDTGERVQAPDITIEEAAPPEPGTAEYVAESMEKMGPEVAAIATEWGGPQSTDFRENMGYLKSAVEHVTRDDPELAELLNAEIEDEHGNVIRLGNHPGLIRAAAEYGRLLANRSGLPVEPVRNGRPSKGGRRGGEAGVDQLTNEMFAALGRGDRIQAARLSKQRDALSKRIWGDT